MKHSPSLLCLGARQAGKSTLAKQYLQTVNQEFHFFDLESDQDLSMFHEAQLLLEPLKGLIVIRPLA